MQVIENHLHRTFALFDGVTLRHGFILHKERSGIKPETVQWHGGRVWFSDWGAQQVIALDGLACARETLTHYLSVRPSAGPA
jgi:hypothetical protein